MLLPIFCRQSPKIRSSNSSTDGSLLYSVSYQERYSSRYRFTIPLCFFRNHLTPEHRWFRFSKALSSSGTFELTATSFPSLTESKAPAYPRSRSWTIVLPPAICPSMPSSGLSPSDVRPSNPSAGSSRQSPCLCRLPPSATRFPASSSHGPAFR